MHDYMVIVKAKCVLRRTFIKAVNQQEAIRVAKKVIKEEGSYIVSELSKTAGRLIKSFNRVDKITLEVEYVN